MHNDNVPVLILKQLIEGVHEVGSVEENRNKRVNYPQASMPHVDEKGYTILDGGTEVMLAVTVRDTLDLESGRPKREMERMRYRWGRV